MLNVLKYNLYRLSKLKTAYVFLVVSVLLGCGFGAMTYMSAVMSGVTAMTMEVSVILVGIVISLFFTNEFKDGIVRDQLVMGYSHSTVFIADSITACLYGVITWLAYIAPYLIVTSVLGMSFDALGIVLGLLAGILSICCACCVFVFISFLTKNSSGIIIVMLTSILLCVFAAIMTSPLATLGVIGEPACSIIVTILRVLPITQITFAETFLVSNIWMVILTAVLFIVAFEIFGIILFKKSNIK